ncbi:MAG: thiamine pyrophosphate-dependent enzyme [Candidatus Latescibacterota bacterium]
MLAVLGQQATHSLGADSRQEVDLAGLCKDVAHHCVQVASVPEQVRTLVDQGLRIAKAERDVTCIVVPSDVQEKDAVESPPRKHRCSCTGIGYEQPRIVPERQDLERAAALPNAGEGVAMLVGAGALHATDEVVQTAELLGNSELITAAGHWQEWSDPRLIVLVLNNGDLNQVTWEQRVFSGDPKFAASQILPRFSYARYAEQLGLAGIEVTDPDDVGEAWDDALSADRPVVVDAHTDPEVTPLPPQITLAQARAWLSAVAQGDPHAPDLTRQTARELVAAWLPGNGE